MIYKTLKKVSDVCQLLDKSKYLATQAINGVTFTNNGDGTITANGTATRNTEIMLLNQKADEGHKYLVYGGPSNGGYGSYRISATIADSSGNYINGFSDSGDGNISPIFEEGQYIRVTISIWPGVNASNLVFKPQLFDLTEMYGSGNEPATVEEFKSKFPNDLYDYSPRCFITSYKDCLKVNDYCQLLDKSKYPATTTKAGVTFTNNGDGSIVVNGTCTADTSLYVGRNVALKNGHQYLLFGAPIRGTWTTIIWTVDKLGSNDNLTGNRYTHKGDNTTSNCYIFVAKDFVADNLVFKPQLFDLTEIYGAGNEPTTVEQFRADFPDELYDYKPYSIVPSYKRSLACKTKNLFDYSKVNNLMYIGGYSINQYFIKNGNKFTITYPISKGATYLDCIIPLKAGTYTLSLFAYGTVLYATSGLFGLVKVEDDYKVQVYNKYKKFWYSGNDRQSYTMNIEEDGNYAVYAYASNGAVPVDSTFWDIQLEEGSTATEYHPYGYL